MKTRLLISLMIAVALVAAALAPALAADQQSVPATVTVAPQVISITLTDYGAPGLNFNPLVAGISGEAGDRDQSSTTPSSTLTVAQETNVHVDIQAKQDKFTGPSGPLSPMDMSAAYDTVAPPDHNGGAYGAWDPNWNPVYYHMAPQRGPSGVDMTAGQSLPLWSSIGCSSSVPSGTYTSVIHFKAVLHV